MDKYFNVFNGGGMNQDPAQECLKQIEELGQFYKDSAQRELDQCHRISCLVAQGQDALDMALENLREARSILLGETV